MRMSETKVLKLDGRVAGHEFTPGCKTGVALESNTGFILKLADGDERGHRELQFYQRVFNDSHPHCLKLRQLVPMFHGCVKIDERLFMRLENISLGRKCVMDVKIGFRTWDRWATGDKILQEKAKFKNGEELGYRILFKAQEGDHVVDFDKTESRVASLEEIISKMGQFLSPSGNVIAKKRRKESFLLRLNEILQFFKQQDIFEFVSSSLLLAYDAESVDDFTNETKIVMIDFAHTSQSDTKDENYSSGLENFINHFSTS